MSGGGTFADSADDMRRLLHDIAEHLATGTPIHGLDYDGQVDCEFCEDLVKRIMPYRAD